MKKSVQFAKISHLVLLCLIGMAGLAAAQGTRFTVQLEAAATPEAAQEKVKQLKAKGVAAYVVKSQVPGKGTFYRVRAGNFPGQAEARKYGSDLQKQGVVAEFFIAAYEKPQAEVTPPPIVAGNKPAKPAAPVAEIPKQPAPKELKEPKEVVKEQPISKPPANPAANQAAHQTVKIEGSEPVPVASSTVMSSPGPAVNNGLSATANNPNSPNNSAPSTPVGAPGAAPLPGSPPTAAPAVSFVKFQDAAIGFSFERPQYWEGGPLDQKDAQDQKVGAGALFQSNQDSAFTHAIWNNLDKANSPDNDNDLIVELILRSMGSGDGTQQMSETGRKVISENGYIKTFLDLRATFKVAGQEGPLDFLGKAVIVRAGKGILLVVTFYSKSGPAYVATLAERVAASAQPPQ